MLGCFCQRNRSEFGVLGLYEIAKGMVEFEESKMAGVLALSSIPLTLKSFSYLRQITGTLLVSPFLE